MFKCKASNLRKQSSNELSIEHPAPRPQFSQAGGFRNDRGGGPAVGNRECPGSNHQRFRRGGRCRVHRGGGAEWIVSGGTKWRVWFWPMDVHSQRQRGRFHFRNG